MAKTVDVALFALLSFGQVADVATTLYGLELPGRQEGNPAIAWCMAELGAAWWTPKLAIPLVALLVLRRVRARWPLAAAAAISIAFVANNIAWLWPT